MIFFLSQLRSGRFFLLFSSPRCHQLGAYASGKVGFIGIAGCDEFGHVDPARTLMYVDSYYPGPRLYSSAPLFDTPALNAG